MKSTEDASPPPSPSSSSSSSSYHIPSWRSGLILLSLWLGTLLVAIDTTIIGTAIPKISSDFKALTQVGWYGSAYMLTLTAFQPIYGNVYKFFNVKVVFLASIILFEAGSILCAAAPTSEVFILGRAIAGIGAAGILQGALAIITFTSPLEKRSGRFAVVISVFGLAVCLGPVLGGVLTDHASWRWCFWINAPVGFVTLATCQIFVQSLTGQNQYAALSHREKLKQFDFLGAALIIGAVCCLLLALQWAGTTYPWRSSQVIGLLVGFFLLTIAFAGLQWKLGERGTIPPRIMCQRTVLFGCLFLFFMQTSAYIKSYFLPFYFQAVQGVSVTASGVRFIPIAATQVFAIVVVGAIVTKTGHYVSFMILGEIVEIIGTYLLSRLKIETPTAEWATYLVLAGLGLGMGQQIPYTAIQVVLSENDVVVGNALATLFGQLGGAIALSIGDSLLVNTLQSQIPARTSAISPEIVISASASNLKTLTKSSNVLRTLREAYAIAIRNTMYFSLAVAVVALGVAGAWVAWAVAGGGIERLNVNVEARKRREKVDEAGEIWDERGQGSTVELVKGGEKV